VIRLACLLVLIALAALLLLVVRDDGPSAIAFSFVGVPALALAIALYGLHRLRTSDSIPSR
jgi:hypothetical protein